MDQRIRGYLDLLDSAPDVAALGEMERTLGDAGAWADLVRIYEQHLKRRPEDDVARERLIRIHRERADEQALCALFEREAARASTPEAAAEAYFVLGENLRSIGHPLRAVEMWQRALRLVPTHRRALEQSRLAFVELGRFEAAQAVIDREVAAAPDEAKEHALRYADLGRRALEQPYRHPIARACAEAALALDPTCVAARMLIDAIEALREGWRDQVRELRARAVEERDRKAAARLYLQVAALHAAFDDPAEADVQVREALRPVFLLWPAMPEALEFLERRHAERDDFDGLAAAWEALVEATTEREARVDLLLRLASLYEVRFDDAARAKGARERAAALDPGRAEAVLPLLEQLREEGRIAEQARLLERYLAGSPAAARQPELHLHLAELYLDSLDEPARARVHLEEAIALDPGNARAHELLEPMLARDPAALSRLLEARAERSVEAGEKADLLLRAAQLRPAAAIDLLSRALGLAPDRADVADALEAAAGDRPEALLRLLREAAEAAAPGARRELLARIARLLEKQPGRAAEATEAWRGLLAEAPDDAEARAAVERLLAASADAAGLVEELEARLRTAPETERLELHGRLAALYEAHEPAAAADHLRALVAASPGDVGLLRRLAASLGAAERWNEQLAAFDQLIAAGDESSRPQRAALLVDRMGRGEQGADDWLAVLERSDEAIAPLERLLHAGVRVEAIAAAIAPRLEAAGEWNRLAALHEARLTGLRDPEERYRLLLALAELREERLADLRGAFAALGRALVERPDDLSLYARLEEMAESIGAAADLAGYCREAWDAAPVEAALRLARHVARGRGDGSLRAAAWRRVLASEPEDDEALAALADAAAEAGHWAEAGSLLERRQAAASPERRAELEVVRARWLARQGAHGHAVEAYRAALAAGVDEAVVLPGLAEALDAAGRQDELVEVIARQAERARAAGDEAEANRLGLRQAQLLTALQRKEEAAGRFASILARDPDDAEAFAAMEALLEEGETAVRAAEVLTEVYEKQGAWQKLRRALEIRLSASTDPAFRLATLRRLATIAGRELRDPALAFDALARAFREAPAEALLRSELRVAAGQAGKLAELAVVMTEVADRLHTTGPLQQAIAIERELAELYEKRLGDPAAAAARHRRIVAADPRNMEALKALHRIQPAIGAWTEQYETCMALAALGRDGAEKRAFWREAVDVASRELRAGDLALAALWLLAEAEPGDAALLAELEALAADQQDWDACAWALERQAETDADAACRLAVVRREKLGEAEEALRLLDRVLAADSRHELARKTLAAWAQDDEAARRRLDGAYAAAGDHEARVALREAQLAAAVDPEIRRGLHEELVAIHERDQGSAALAFVAAARGFAECPELEGTLERLAAATGSWEELVAIYEEAAEERPALLRRIAQIKGRELDDADGAAAAWTALLASAPDDEEALEALASLHAAAERWEDLVEILRRRAARAEGPRRLELLMQAADACAIDLDDPARAVAFSREALAIDADHAPALEMLALHLHEEEDRGELLDVLERLAAIQPAGSDARVESLLRRAALLSGVGATEDALRACGQVLAERQGEPRAVATLEQLLAAGVAGAAALLEPVYRAAGDGTRLLAVLERRLVDAAPGERAALLAEMTELRLADGDAEAAWPLALARFAAAPDDPAAWESLRSLADRTNHHEALADALENALAERSTDRELLVRLAAVQEEKLGRAADARATWERVLAFDSADVEALRAVCRLAAVEGAFAREHEALLRLAALLEGEAAELIRAAARVADEKLQDADLALTDYRRLLAARPDDADALAAVERLLGATGRWEELARHLEARADEPGVALRLAALRQERLGDVQGALELYAAHLEAPAAREALEAWIRSGAAGAGAALEILDPVLGDAALRAELRDLRLAGATGDERRRLLAELADLRESLGDAGAAFAACLALFAEDPADSVLRDRLVALAEATFGWEELAATFERALRVLPAESADALALWELLAPIYGERLGRPDEAAAAWEQLAAARPGDPAPLAQLDSIYRGRGAFRELSTVLRRKAAHEEAPEKRKDLLLEMAILLEEQLGDREAAMAAYREILTIDETHPEAFAALCRLLGEAASWGELAGLLERQVEIASRGGLADEARELRFRLGRILQQHTGDTNRAVELFRSVLGEQPRHPATLAALEELSQAAEVRDRALAAELLAPIYAEERNWQRHVQMLDALAAAAIEPARRAELHRAAAGVYAAELDAQEMAFLAAGRALEADPDGAENLALVLRAAEASGDVEEELAALLAAAADDARTEEGRVALLRAHARHLERMGDESAVRAAWTKLRNAAPDDAEALRALAALHARAGDVDEQLEALRSLLAREEENGARRQLLLEIAVVQEERKRDLPGAISTLRRLLEVSPYDAEALSRLDVLCVQQERWIDLADVLAREEKAAAQRGDAAAQVEFLFRLAELREGRLLDSEGAFALYRRILEIDPAHARTHARLEAILDEDPTHLEAIELLENAFRAAGDAARLADILEARVAATHDAEARRAVLVELGEIRAARQNRHDLAFLAFSRAFREAPADRAIWQRLWQEAAATDAGEEWLALQEEALPRLGPDDVEEFALHVARLCERPLGDEAAAAAWYGRARNSTEALVALERLHRTAERWSDLADVLEALAERESDPREKVNLLFRLGRLAEERLAAPERAIAAYERLLEVDPKHLPTLRALEPLQEAAGNAEALYRVLAAQRDALPEGSAWQRLALRLAEVAASGLGDPDRAAAHYREVLERNPRNDAAHQGLAALLEQGQRWQELAEVLQARMKSTVDPREIAALNERLGRLQAEHLEDADAAVASYRAVLERDPRNRRALEALRRLHAARNEGEALAGVLRRLIPLQEDARGVKAVRLELAETLAAAGRREEAVENGKRVLDLEPHDLPQLQRVELLFRDLNAWPEVIRTMELQAPLLAADEELVVDLWRGVARLWEEQLQRREGAAAALEKILERRLDEEAFDRLRAIYRDVADWRRYAQVTERFAAGWPDPARKVELLRELGHVHETRLGQREIAFAKLGAAFELQPGDADLRAHLAALADDGGMHEELAMIYESVIDLWEDEPIAATLLLELGRLQDEKLDDPEAAEASLRRILAVDPVHAEALETLAGLFSRRGQDRALRDVLEQQLEATVELEDRRNLLRRLAAVAEDRLGDREEAARWMERALELDPAHVETREALAALYGRAGRLRDVATLLARSRDLAATEQERFALQVRLATLLENDLDDDEAARNAWALAHELDPARLEPLDALERIHTRHDRWAELLRVYDRKLQIVENEEERCRLLLKVASIHEEQFDNLPDAIAALDAARRAAPGNRLVLRELARLLRAAGEWRRLGEVIEAHLSLLESDAAAAAERVDLLVRLGDLRARELGESAAAEQAWRAALSLDPNARAALHALGRHLEGTGAWTEALEMLRREARLLGASPEALELHLRIGRIHAGPLGDAEAALAAWRTALSIDEGYVPALRALRELHEARGEAEAFLDALTREAMHVEASGEKTALWNEVGRHRLARGEEEAAIRAYEEARRHTPEDLDANLALGDLWFAREAWARAESALDVVCAGLSPHGGPEAIRLLAHKFYRLGAACERQEKIQKALQAYARAWESDPGQLAAGEGLARLLVRTGDDAQALRVYQAILIHHRDELSDPEVVELHYAIGEIRRRLGDDEAALKSFRAALELDAWHVDSHRAVIALAEATGDLALSVEHRQRLADILEGDEKHALLVESAELAATRLNDPWQAIDACNAALRIRPDDLDTAERLLGLYRQTRQGARAVDLLERLLAHPQVQADPQRRIRCHLHLGEHYRAEPPGDATALAAAVEHFNAALDLDWRQTAAFQAIEAMLVERQEWRLLEANYVRMLQRLPREEASRQARVLLYRTLADLYRNALQDHDAAAEAWKAVTLLAPDDGEAAANWAELVTGKPGAELEAIAAWRKALPVAPDLAGAARTLERLHARRRSYDAAFVAASVVADLLGKGGSDEEGLLERLRPFARTQAEGVLTDNHWVELSHEGVRGPVAQIFAIVHVHAGALLAADFGAVPLQGRVVQIDRKRDRVDVDGMLYLANAYKRVAATLGVPVPELYKVAGVSGIEIANTWPPSVVAGEEMFAGQGSRRQLAFLIGRNLAFSRHPLALARFHTAENLEVLLQAAVLLGEPRFKRTADAALVEKTRDKLARVLPPEAIKALQKIAYAYARDRNRQSVRAYLEAAELTADRVGTLLAGDLAVARHQLAAETGAAPALPLDRRIRELAVFALSEAFLDLRKALGLSVQIPG